MKSLLQFISISIFLNFLYLNSCWKFQIETFLENTDEWIQNQNEVVEELDDQIQRSIVLQDGRRLQCSIPINLDEFNLQEEQQAEQEQDEEEISDLLQKHSTSDKKSNQSLIQLNYTEEKIYLDRLVNQCANYRTKEFLWQYCYRKYLKQYDDLTTIKNANKAGPETFYLGFHILYHNKSNNSGISTIYENIYDIRSRNIINNSTLKIPQIFIFGKIGLAFNLQNTISDQKNNMIFLKNNLVLNISKVFQQEQIFILEEEVDLKNHGFQKQNLLNNPLYNYIQETEFYNLTDFNIYYNQHKPDQKSVRLINVFHQTIIYLKKIKGISEIIENQSVLIVCKYSGSVESYYQFVTIKKVWSDNLIEVYEKIESLLVQDLLSIRKPDDGYQHQDNQFNYDLDEDRKITIQNGYLFPSYDIHENDIIKFLDEIKFGQIKFSKECRVQKVFYNIAKMDQGCQEGTLSGLAIIGHHHLNQNKQNILQQKNQLPTSFGVRTNLQKQISFSTHPKNHLQFVNLFDFEESKQKEILFLFNLKQTNKSEPYNFNLIFTENLPKPGLELDWIEIKFFNNNEILAKRKGILKNMKRQNQYHENMTISDNYFWIAVINNTIKLGRGDQIKASNLLLEFNQIDHLNIKYISIIGTQCKNVEISYLNFFPIDIDVLSSINNMDRKPPKQVNNSQLTTDESLIDGDYCSSVKQNRTTHIKFKCDESFFRIKSITETIPCVYNIQVGTNLLCQPEEKQIKTKQLSERIDKIKCVIKS